MSLKLKGKILLASLIIFLSYYVSFSFASQWVNPKDRFKDPNEVRLQRGEKKLTETEKENIKKYGFTGLEVMTYSFCNTEPGYHDWTCCTNFYNYLPGQKVLRKTFTQREIYCYKSKAALVNLVGIDPGDTMRR